MPGDNIVNGINESLNYLAPEVEVINDCRETILLLNKIERALTLLLADIVLQQGVASRSNVDRELIKEQIEIILTTLKEGKVKIIQGEQEIGVFYEGIFELLKHLKSNFTDPIEVDTASNSWGAYVAHSGYYMLTWPFSMFSQTPPTGKYTPSDALNELLIVTKELGETIEQMNALEIVQKKLVEDSKPRGYRP